MIPRFSLLFSALALAAASATAQTLVHSYDFNGNLNDSTGSVALTNPNGGSVGSGVFNFAAGQGLSFVGELGLQSTYTIAIRFRFDAVDSYAKLLDFKDRTTDNGVYVNSSAFTFYNALVSGGTIAANTYTDFILTRDSGGVVSAYDGSSATPLFSFTDSSSYGVANGDNSATNAVLWFFRDDVAQNAEHVGGQVDRILIYNGALSGAATVGVLSAIPEPSTYAAIAGAVGLAIAVWTRRRKPADTF